LVSDGVFSKSKSIIFQKETNPKYFNSIALRGSIKNIESSDISIYLGSNFHFVIYPVNQNKEFNFISIIRKSLKKEQMIDKNYFQNYDFLESLVDEISSKTSFNLKDKIENIKSFPIFISDKFIKPEEKNIFFVGDALYAFPPSFAQGASQSIEASKEVYEEIENNTYTYYEKRHKKIKSVNSRSIINHFVFHLSNPLIILIRNIVLKYLTKNKRFLENYLGKIYKN
jgi:salicylate hydroxylase